MNTHVPFGDRARILLVSDDRAASGFMSDALASMSRFDVEHLSMDDFLARADGEPSVFDLIVLDVGAGRALEREQLFAFRARNRDVPLLIVSDQLQDDAMRLVFRLNGNDWLKKPLARKPFIDMVVMHAPGSAGRQGRVHAVVSAVGGAGASVIAASLAHAIANQKRKTDVQVELFDMDFSLGSLALYLGLANDNDLKPVIANPSRVDAEFVDLVRQHHDGGFSVLSFKQPGVLLSPKGSELVLRMLDAVALGSDHTILDIPYYVTPWRDDVLKSVNTVYVVTEMTVPALRQAKELAQRLERLRGGSQSMFIVINKYRSRLFGLDVRKRQTKRLFKQPNLHFVPDDWGTLSEAVNRGVLPAEVTSRSKFYAAVAKLGELVQ